MAILLMIVVTFGVLSTITCADRAEELKASVGKLEELIKEEKEKNKEITEILANLSEQMAVDLASLQIHDDAITTGIDKEADVLLKHRDDLGKKYKEEADLLKDIEDLENWMNLQNKKLDILKQDLELLSTRRRQGQDLECQKLISNSSISLRSLRRRNDDELVYSALLPRLETVLAHTKRHHEQLRRELEHKMQLKKDIKESLEEKVALSAHDLGKMGNAVIKLKRSGEEAQANIDKLLTRVYGLEKQKKSTEAQVQQTLAELEDYEQDSVCFNTLTRRIQKKGEMLEPNP